MIKMDIFMTLTIVFFVVILIESYMLWTARYFMIKIFGSVRHWFMRHLGYGFAYFYEPNKRLIRHYCKLNEKTIRFRESTYVNIPEKQFDFEGIRSIMYNLNDAVPIDPYKENSKKLEDDPKFWDNFSKLLRMYYQTQTNESLVFWITLGTIALVAIGLGMTGYMIHQQTEIIEVCRNAARGVVNI